MSRRPWIVAVAGVLAASVAPAEQTLKFGRFGEVALYGDPKTASQVVVFVSADSGWNEGVVDMAHDLVATGALVIGTDIRRYLKALSAEKGRCAYPAADFEALSQALQKNLGAPRYSPPLLFGYSSGATLVYAALAQAPPNTFSGAISVGFCPTLAFPRPMCSGGGLKSAASGRGLRFEPGPLPAPWVVLQGEADQVCGPGEAAAFVRQVPAARLIELPKVGHGFSKAAHWLPQLKAAAAQLPAENRSVPVLAAKVDGLPLVEVPAQGAGDTLAVIVTGDGGWASIDKWLGEAFSAAGIPVVGLDSVRYFWKKRDPDEAGQDLARIARHYFATWRKEKLLLVGYSSGADVLPFMANRLPPDLLARVKLVALLSPAKQASFEFHVSQWFISATRDARPVMPEVAKLEGTKVLCIYGDQETDTLCPALGAGLAALKQLGGGHHYGRDFRTLAREILKAAE